MIPMGDLISMARLLEGSVGCGVVGYFYEYGRILHVEISLNKYIGYSRDQRFNATSTLCCTNLAIGG
jgi:hypothetical protein